MAVDLFGLAKTIKGAVQTAKNKAKVSSSGGGASKPASGLSKLITKAHAAPLDNDAEIEAIMSGKSIPTSSTGGNDADVEAIMSGTAKSETQTPSQPQPRPLIELQQEAAASQQARSRTGDTLSAPKQENFGDFLGRFGQNLVKAPGQLVSSIGDVVTGKAGEKVNKAAQAYVEDVKSGREQPLVSGIPGEVTQALGGIVGQVPRIAGNFADLLVNAVPVVGPSLPKPSGLTNQLGDVIEGSATALTGVPKESVSGEIGRTATTLASLVSPSKAVGDVVEGINVLKNVKTGAGSIARAEKILKGSESAKAGGDILNYMEKFKNKGPELVKSYLKSSLKGAGETALYTQATEGRLPKADELALGVATGNVMDMFGGVLKGNAVKKYKKAFELFSGNAEEAATLSKKSAQAIEEGFTGGKSAEDMLELANTKIASYSKPVNEAIASSKVEYGSEFYDSIYSKIAGMEKTDPAQAKVMKDALDQISGKGFKIQSVELDSKIADAQGKVDRTRESLELLKEKGNKIQINNKTDALNSSVRNLNSLKSQKEEVERLAQLTSRPKTLEDLRTNKQIAAERNPSIVGGMAQPSAKDAAVNKVWMMIRDHSEDYLNKKIPHLAEINSRLNTAYRVKDAVENLVKKGKDLGKTRATGFQYFRGKQLQSSTTKNLARKAVFDTNSGLKDLIGKGQKAAGDAVGGAVNAAGKAYSGLNSLFTK